MAKACAQMESVTTLLVHINRIRFKLVYVVAMVIPAGPKVTVRELLPILRLLTSARKLAKGGGYARKTSFLVRCAAVQVATAIALLFGLLHSSKVWYILIGFIAKFLRLP